ncbi:hypothetical protein ACI784_15245 [Geodermatophilus sp. SYSU D01186]
MIFTATTALPYEHLDRATAGLRAMLRVPLLADDIALPDWSTLQANGPVARIDSKGRAWYEYAATVKSYQVESDAAPS